MLSKVVTNKDGVEKTVYANSQEDLDEAVKAVKSESPRVVPNIDDPEDGNKVVDEKSVHVGQNDYTPEEPKKTKKSSK